MKLRGPQSLNGLILVGFALVALPLLVAVVWALFNLDRLAEQSEAIIAMGVQSTENNRLLAEDVVQLQRSTNQYYVLRNDESRKMGEFDMSLVEMFMATIKEKWIQMRLKMKQPMIVLTNVFQIIPI